jgi:molybdopterin converting factor subunit 1
MNIKVRFFASVREIAGKSETDLQVEAGATVSGLMTILQGIFPRLSPAGMMVAVNQEFAAPGAVLREGDEVALLPPVSGG